MRAAIEAHDHDGVAAAKQLVHRIDQLDIELDDLRFPLRQAVNALRNIGTRRRGKRHDYAQARQIAGSLGVVEELRVGDRLVVVEPQDADAHWLRGLSPCDARGKKGDQREKMTKVGHR